MGFQSFICSIKRGMASGGDMIEKVSHSQFNARKLNCKAKQIIKMPLHPFVHDFESYMEKAAHTAY